MSADPTKAKEIKDSYSISVAADTVGVGVQSLRLYETKGLLTPFRTSGGTRRYSVPDLVRLKRIVELLRVGVNLAGIEIILGLEDENARLWAVLKNDLNSSPEH